MSKKRKFEADVKVNSKPIENSIEKHSSTLEADLNIEENEDPSATAKEISSKKKLSSKGSLPDLLPAEYLEDFGTQGLVSLDDLPIKPRKTKFQQVAEREPKDKRVGTNTYRVTKASSKNLAPKASNSARSTKEAWLQGRSGKTVSSKRTPFTKGFFKK